MQSDVRIPVAHCIPPIKLKRYFERFENEWNIPRYSGAGIGHYELIIENLGEIKGGGQIPSKALGLYSLSFTLTKNKGLQKMKYKNMLSVPCCCVVGGMQLSSKPSGRSGYQDYEPGGELMWGSTPIVTLQYWKN